MLPIPLTDTPASAPDDRDPRRACLRGGVDGASPPSAGGAHRVAWPTAFAALMDAGLVKATLVAGAAGVNAGLSSGLDDAGVAAASNDDGSAPAAAVVPAAKAVNLAQRTIAGQPSRMLRVDAATVLPAWMPSTKATASLQRDALADAASDDDDAGDVAFDGVAQGLTETAANMPPVIAVGIDPQILATQIPVPGDEDATPGDDASQPSADGAAIVTGTDQGTADSRFTLNSRSLLTLNAPDQRAGTSRGAQMAMAHASDQALAHASSNSVLSPTATDSLSTDTDGVDGSSTDASLLDQVSTPTPPRAERLPDGAKPGRAAVREIARSFSAATPPATTTATTPVSDVATQSGATRSKSLDATPAQPDGSNKLSIAVDAATRRSETAAIPSIRFADTADTDGGAQSNSEDAPRGQHQQSASAATRLMAGVVSAAGDAHASTQAHTVAPVFSVPTTATTSALPTVTSTEAAAPASAPTSDAQNIDRLVQSMHVSAKSGVMEATVRLRPEYLGDVTIELRVDGTGVSAVVRAESANVRQWLESNEQTIRSGLAEHGLELTRFIVDPDGQPQSQQDAQPDRDEQRRAAFRRRQQGSSSQRFEITV